MAEGSVAPKERVNIVYKPAIGDTSEDVELPLKMLVVGDFTGKESDDIVEERNPININKDNFDDVLKSHDVSIETAVPNTLSEAEGDEMNVSLKVSCMKDFGPERVVEQVPELQKLLELRQALTALKGPLGNVPAFRKAIQSLLEDEDTKKQIMDELKLD